MRLSASATRVQWHRRLCKTFAPKPNETVKLFTILNACRVKLEVSNQTRLQWLRLYISNILISDN